MTPDGPFGYPVLDQTFKNGSEIQRTKGSFRFILLAGVTERTIPDGILGSPLAAAALALAHFQADPLLSHCTCELLTSFQCTLCART